ncbi:hypothetical protein Slin15195_G022230 [Septoria linicola]|uniref:Uncharacterized protein n=1 Tax=Septoria linicola TaxID=215465 RepID=A0A9Q9AGB4_9PEZI|nr:hypothetical protein Slin14017_G021260 [Septoria linicola]USW48904.1 hypothetical protein Slin15195_G022230 [Septoria linicola]
MQFFSLKSLSMSVTDKVFTEDRLYPYEMENLDDSTGAHGQALQTALREERGFSCLADLVQRCCNLGTLESSGFYHNSRDRVLNETRRKMWPQYVHELAKREPLRKLMKLRLAALDIIAEDVLTLLQNHSRSLEDVDLTHFTVVQGSLALIMSYLGGGLEYLTHLRLDDLRDKGNLAPLHNDQKSENTVINGYHKSRNAMERWGDDASKVTHYYVYNGIAIGSSRVQSATMRMHKEYGKRGADG